VPEELNILIAEDEYLSLMGVHSNLEVLGYNVVGETGDGKEAVKLALEKKPDLILMDINMPSLDGIEAIKQINSKLFIPSIIISGYHDKKLINRAREAGVFGYLVKPIDIHDLKTAIKIALSKYEEFQNLKNELNDTKEALENRKYIERAKGILMDTKNLKEEAAMKKLQHLSRNNNKKIIEIAKEVIKADKILNL